MRNVPLLLTRFPFAHPLVPPTTTTWHRKRIGSRGYGATGPQRISRRTNRERRESWHGDTPTITMKQQRGKKIVPGECTRDGYSYECNEAVDPAGVTVNLFEASLCKNEKQKVYLNYRRRTWGTCIVVIVLDLFSVFCHSIVSQTLWYARASLRK